MKERASFTFDKETIKILDELIEVGEFRNRSHVVEHAIKVLVDEQLKNKEVKKK